jgi:hypothetical protein
MKSTHNQLVQASLLSARYHMPTRTLIAWQKATGIDGYPGWIKVYGPEARPGITNQQSHDQCYQDICDWIVRK